METISGEDAVLRARYFGGLAFLAVEWLADHAGEHAILEYYRVLRSGKDWQPAFETAFGISVDDFYEAFEKHRAEVAPASVLHRVSGVMLDPDGYPVAGVQIATRRREQMVAFEGFTITEVDGTFELRVADGGYYFEITGPGGRFHIVHDAEGPNSTSSLIIVNGADVAGIEIRIPASALRGNR